MRGWFEFGYNGFPSGEARKRFFRQRDDPCGSEDDNDYDDETNDRPVYYYPLRRSEEGSSAASSNCIPSDEDEEATAGHEPTPAMPLYAETTAHEAAVAWCGASLVEFVDHSGASDLSGRSRETTAGHCAESHYVLWHGGAPIAERRVATGAFTLGRLVRRPCSHRTYRATTPASSNGGGGGSQMDYVPVPYDASLEAVLRTPLSHPALRACMAPALRTGVTPQARFGHCAAPVALPPRLAQTLLTEGLVEPTRGAAGRIECPPVEGFLAPSTPNTEDYTLFLSFVIGGSEQVPSPTSSASPVGSQRSASYDGGGVGDHPLPGGGYHGERLHPSPPPSSHSGYGGYGWGTDTVLSPIRTVTMSKPSLCFTLVRRPSSAAGAAHWTRSFELWGDSLLPLEPRMFSTLTPWPREDEGVDEAGRATHCRAALGDVATSSGLTSSAAGTSGHAAGQPQRQTLCFAYCGGTETGIDPVPLFALTRIQLDCESWQWSARVEPTLGAEPCARFGHSASYWDGCLMVFGGVGRGRRFLNDLHILDARTMVWREVFVPLNVGLPPRAFHCAPLLLGAGEAAGGAASDPCGGRAAMGVLEPAEALGDSLTVHATGARLMVVGGEGDAGVEPSVWVCELDTGAWQPCLLPLMSQLPSYRVARRVVASSGVLGSGDRGNPSRTGDPRRGGGDGGGAELTPCRLQQTVRALVDRRQDPFGGGHRGGGSRGSVVGSLASAPACGSPLTPTGVRRTTLQGHDETTLFIATVHGSLACAVSLPSRVGGGVLVMGGTRSPPVLLVTQLEAPAGSLKELAAFWLFSSPHSLPTSLIQRSPAYFSRMLRGSRFDTHVAAALDRFGVGAFPPWDDQEAGGGGGDGSRQTRPTSLGELQSHSPVSPSAPVRAVGGEEEATHAETMAETQRLVSLGALDEQMSLWVRSAKRRLRCGPFS